MTETIPGVAKFAGKSADGKNVWEVDGKMLGDEEFDALIARQYKPYETEHMLNSIVGERLVGLDVQKAAEEDLRGRGVDPDTADTETLLAAYRRVMS